MNLLLTQPRNHPGTRNKEHHPLCSSPSLAPLLHAPMPCPILDPYRAREGWTLLAWLTSWRSEPPLCHHPPALLAKRSGYLPPHPKKIMVGLPLQWTLWQLWIYGIGTVEMNNLHYYRILLSGTLGFIRSSHSIVFPWKPQNKVLVLVSVLNVWTFCFLARTPIPPSHTQSPNPPMEDAIFYLKQLNEMEHCLR